MKNRKLKILCIADHVDPLVYSNALKEHFGDVNAVISCGDLKRNYYDYIVSTLNIPFVYVLGNHSQFSIEKSMSNEFNYENLKNRKRLFPGGILADGRCRYLKELNLIVIGFGGSIRYNNGENQYTEFDMTLRILRLLPRLLFNKIFRGRYLDILITHAPPRHVNDGEDPCHRGFRIFRWFLRRFKPVCMLHGHVHLYNNSAERVSYYNGIPVINAYKHYVLNLPLKEI
ncbi:MAG TPA: metallophosphoesterase [Spirochaeta sp.]|nr:metallophosphoesterase [Spirochaeta sp.]